jgi:hypothetical protein
METKIETLKKWITTGQVRTSNGRSMDDLMTLVNQIEKTTPKEEVKELPGEIIIGVPDPNSKINGVDYENHLISIDDVDNAIINEILKIAYKAVPKKCSLDGNKLLEVHDEMGYFLSEKFNTLSPDPSNTIEIDGEVAAKLDKIISKIKSGESSNEKEIGDRWIGYLIDKRRSQGPEYVFFIRMALRGYFNDIAAVTKEKESKGEELVEAVKEFMIAVNVRFPLVSVDDPKSMACYNAYHKLKDILTKLNK